MNFDKTSRTKCRIFGRGCGFLAWRKSLLGLAAAVLAAGAPARGDDLWTVYQIALTQDAVYRAASHTHEIARREVPRARAAVLPVLSLSASAARNRPPVATGAGQAQDDSERIDNYAAQASMKVFDVAALVGISQAKLRRSGARLRFAAAEEALILRVATAYFRLLAADDSLQVALRQHAAIKRQMDFAQQRLEVGLGTRTDLYDAEARLAQATADVLAVHNAIDNAAQALKQITGGRSAGGGMVDREIVHGQIIDDNIAIAQTADGEIGDGKEITAEQTADGQIIDREIAIAQVIDKKTATPQITDEQIDSHRQPTIEQTIAQLIAEQTTAGKITFGGQITVRQPPYPPALAGQRHVTARSLTPLGDDLPLQLPQPPQLEAWVAAALNNNLALAAARLEVRAAAKEITKQRAARLPSIEVQATRQRRDYAHTPTYHSSAAATLNWPLVRGGAIFQQSRQASARLRLAEQTTEALRRQVEADAVSAYLAIASGVSQVQALAHAVRAGENSLQAKQEGFRAGLTTNLDVLDAQRDLSRSRTDHLRARYDYILSTLRLQQAAGDLDADDVKRINAWLSH